MELFPTVTTHADYLQIPSREKGSALKFLENSAGSFLSLESFLNHQGKKTPFFVDNHFTPMYEVK